MSSSPMDSHPDDSVEIIHPRQSKDERIDFRGMEPEIAARYLMSELRHPAVHHMDADELTDFIKRLISGDGDTHSLATVIANHMSHSRITDNDVYDDKLARDEVFHYMARVLQETRGDLSKSAQRRLILELMDFRGAFRATATADDAEWHDIVNRLMA